MARDLKVPFTNEKPYYFISYNSEDEAVVSEYVKCLTDKGLPVWYDRALEAGRKWEEAISIHIAECETVIMFLSKNIFEKETSYVHKEFEMATEYFSKRVIVVLLDKIDKKEVPPRFVSWWIDVNSLHCIEAFNCENAEVCASVILEALNFSEKRNSSKSACDREIVSIGEYIQSGTTDKPEPVEWIVLEKDERKMLLLSRLAIECMPVNNQYAKIDWDSCDLNKWLNEEFYYKAFSDTEKEKIINSAVKADGNEKYISTPSGRDSFNRIFLLSIKEIETYLENDEDRICTPTDYAVQKGAAVYGELKSCWWWSRTSGRNPYYMADINKTGGIAYGGHAVLDDDLAVRPAMWIKTDK